MLRHCVTRLFRLLSINLSNNIIEIRFSEAVINIGLLLEIRVGGKGLGAVLDNGGCVVHFTVLSWKESASNSFFG